MKRTVYLWNLMIRDSTNSALFTRTLELYSWMLRTGLHGNDFTFPLVLKACSNTNSLRDATKVHSHAFLLGFQAHVFVQTALLDMYSKCHHLHSSRKVFDEMPVRTVVSWNSIISAYCRSFLFHEATLLLREMRLLGLDLSSTTFLSFLSTTPIPLRQGLSIHCCVFKLGLLNTYDHIPLANAVMSMYIRYGQVHEARAILDSMHEISVVSWSTIIGGYVDTGNVDKAFSMFNRMRTISTINSDFVVFINLIKGCAKQGSLMAASSLHSLILKCGCENNDPLDNLLLGMYAKCGDLISARKVFDMALVKTVFLWTSIIGGYTHMGYPAEALLLFKKLLKTAIKPNGATLATILSACADLGSLDMGKEIEEYILSNGFQSDRQVQTSLIHMFSKCGSIDKAISVFERISDKDLAAWSSMINGYAIHGMAEEALGLFHKMLKIKEIKPDAVVFTSILLACSHVGLVEDGLTFFKSMQKDFGVVPSVEHYMCLVDLLGRAGQFELALKTIRVMPVKLQAQVWAPFLSACTKHCNLELGELAARKLLHMNPGSHGNYVLMANLYTSMGKWKEAAVTRSLMIDRGLVKAPGWSQVEINGSVHVFIAGDRSHAQSIDIYKKLEEINLKLAEAGYVPETDTVIHDLEREEKEEALKVHSERLAIACGLISTEAGSTLRIMKNHRTCVDCHSALKFISKITSRHLIVRDGSRFHHFESGTCTCKDFW
ncbi:hypothetical protein POTOM_057790 [Populus tomentosa]|uniref:DYW domain-containing protein n=1 Tax=Populus tomentosa TaxID=118781 RepID=A0A8X8C3R8_POPTO|nr:hypothetical protein POTOM_057790 [Populus tomentosa]